MVYWIVFLPLMGFIFCASFGNRFDDRYSQIITSGFLTISSILSWIIFFEFIGKVAVQEFHLLNWITSGDFFVNWSLFYFIYALPQYFFGSDIIIGRLTSILYSVLIFFIITQFYFFKNLGYPTTEKLPD